MQEKITVHREGDHTTEFRPTTDTGNTDMENIDIIYTIQESKKSLNGTTMNEDYGNDSDNTVEEVTPDKAP